MARYKLMDRHLSKLLPVSFSEQILAGTFEYAVNWLVDHQIDRSVFDPRYSNDEAGASAYDPSGLLKIVLLGYARGLTSSRSIDRACRENVVFMALSGDSAPHFTTIAAFIARMPGEITSVFRDVLLVCDEQGLIGRELFAVDGCKLPSNASRTWSGTKAELAKKAQKMEKAIGYLLDTHRRQDSGQNQATLVVRECQQIETLSRNSRKLREWLAVNPEKTNRRGQALKSNVTDPESATMKTSHGVVQGYTGVAAVDAKARSWCRQKPSAPARRTACCRRCWKVSARTSKPSAERIPCARPPCSPTRVTTRRPRSGNWPTGTSTPWSPIPAFDPAIRALQRLTGTSPRTNPGSPASGTRNGCKPSTSTTTPRSGPVAAPRASRSSSAPETRSSRDGAA